MLIIDGYTVDAALTENHNLSADVTEFPVEDGSTISDHVIVKPRQYSCTGVISNSPLAAIAALRNAATEPATEGRQILEAILETKKVITIQTTLRSYANMVMESLSFEESSTTGDALRFAASFRQITITTNIRSKQTVRAVRIAKSKQDLGNRIAGYIGTDKQGRQITANTLGPGIEPTYTRADGTKVSAEEARDAAKRSGTVLVKYDANGKAIPVNNQDYQPNTPKQKKPFWQNSMRSETAPKFGLGF